MKLPVELLDIILKFTGNFRLILPFSKYMSPETRDHLLKDKDIYEMAKNGDIEGVKVLLKVDYYDPEKLLRYSIISRNICVFIVCYDLHSDIFWEKNITNSIIKRDLVDFFYFLHGKYRYKSLLHFYSTALRYNSLKILKFLKDVHNIGERKR